MKQEDFAWYLENKDKLLSNNDYNGKYLVIKNKEVIGAYTNEYDAIFKTLEQYKGQDISYIVYESIEIL